MTPGGTPLSPMLQDQWSMKEMLENIDRSFKLCHNLFGTIGRQKIHGAELTCLWGAPVLPKAGSQSVAL